jgi:hypothetical protein
VVKKALLAGEIGVSFWQLELICYLEFVLFFDFMPRSAVKT